MTTVTIKKAAMNILKARPELQPLAHTIGMDYPAGYYFIGGVPIFISYRNFFSAPQESDVFQQEVEEGLVERSNIDPTNDSYLYRLTEKGAKYLEKQFNVWIVRGEWI